MRVIVRKERPHPGAQLRLTDPDGHRYTAFATNTRPGGSHRQLADLELRHRRRARAEDRIRAAKDTGLRNLPLHELDQNRIWQAVVALACEITAWTQTARLHRAPRTAVGTQTAPAADLLPARPGSPVTPAASCCTCPPTHPGPGSPSTASTGCARSPSPAEHHPARPDDPGTRPDPWNRRPERPRPNCHTQPAESPSPHRPAPVLDQASIVRRKIRANDRMAGQGDLQED